MGILGVTFWVTLAVCLGKGTESFVNAAVDSIEEMSLLIKAGGFGRQNR